MRWDGKNQSASDAYGNMTHFSQDLENLSNLYFQWLIGRDNTFLHIKLQNNAIPASHLFEYFPRSHLFLRNKAPDTSPESPVVAACLPSL